VSFRSCVSGVLCAVLLAACQGQSGEQASAPRSECGDAPCDVEGDVLVVHDGATGEGDGVSALDVAATPAESLLVTEARASGLLKYIDEGPAPVVESVEGDTTVYAFEPGDGPRCMRGGEFRFSVRDTGSENLLIFLQGGGTCWSDFCLTVTAAPAGVPLVESLDPDNPSNPLADWTVLYLPYCDGSFFTGDRDFDEDGDGVGERLHRGLQNLSGALRTIRERFPNPARVLLTGSSAGAFGTIPGSVLVRSVYPEATLQVFNDSGVGVVRPGEPAFVEKILDEQGLIPLIPETCVDCWADGHITRLVHWIFERDPDIQMAVFSSMHDSIIAGTFLSLDPEIFKETMLAETQALHDRFPDRYRRFIVQGITHTTLLGTPIGIIGEDIANVEFSSGALTGLGTIKLGGLDTTVIGDTTAGDWLRAFVEGTAEWTDRVEADPPEAAPDPPIDEERESE
jgi:hypothetical protein